MFNDPCKVTFNADALIHNLAIAKAFATNSKIVAMVKANAYGHGLIKVSQVIDDKVDYLAVARISEAIQLRNAGIKSKILLVEGILNNEELIDVCSYDLSIVVHETWQIETLLESKFSSYKFDVWLKYDAGMHRLGFKDLQFKQALKKLQSCDWVSKNIKFMTHFSCAAHKEQLLTNFQYKKFCQIISDYCAYDVSVANSAAIISFSDSHNQYIRPGIMLYGSSPVPHQSANSLGLKPVMTFESKIISLRDCKVGETVGYDATWQAKKTTVIATIAAGYGDGYPRGVNDDAYVLINNIKCPIVGCVSMDMLTVDVGHVSDVKIGNKVLLWGEGLSVDIVAAFSNTISYDLLCRAGLNSYR